VFPDSSNPNQGVLSSQRFAWVSASILAAFALCVATCTQTPAYASSSKASADSASKNQTIHIGTIVPDDPGNGSGFNSDLSGIHPDLTITYKGLHRGITYGLTNLVLYNGACEEVTAGTWYLASAPPTYGKVTQGYTHGRLANGACPGRTFKSREIYYTWTHDAKARHDHFKAYWAGAGKRTNAITFNFDLVP
jgi:hypothetical protein